MNVYPPERNCRLVRGGSAIVRFTLGAVFILTLSTQAQTGGGVTLAWNPVGDPHLAGYHVYQGVRSGSYTNVIALGNQTNITVSGLVIGVKYFFAVTDYTTAGVESPFSNEVSFTPTNNASLTTTLSFASTLGTINSPFITGNGTVYQPAESTVTTGGEVDYSFYIGTAGDYIVNAMTIAPSTAQNSFYVNVDAQPTDPTMIWDVPISTSFIQSPVCWRGTNSSGAPGADQFTPKIFNLSVGTHQLIVRGREPNTQLGTITISLTNSSVTPTVAPVIALTSPNNNSSYAAPANLALAASVTPNGHTISQVQFFNGSTLIGQSATIPYSFSWNNVGAGNYRLAAIAIYDTNNTVSSAAVSVSVTNPLAQPASISFASTSGTISSPFVTGSGTVYQPTESTVTTGGEADYSFYIGTAGDYIVSAMTIAPSTAQNSFYVNVDAEPTDPTMIWDVPISTSFIQSPVCWRGTNSSGAPGADQFTPKVFNLSVGTHQLIVRGREPNTKLGTITIAPASVLPPPWQVLDIGNVGTTGSASVSAGNFSVSGGGIMSGSSDGFRFLYQPMTGDGDLRAQINSLQNATTNGRVGVIIRETLTPGSDYAFMGISADGTVRSQTRTATSSGSSSSSSGTLAASNAWARLVRSGNSFLAYKSSDGASWILVSSNSIAMATNIYFGLAVASGSTNSVATATFTNVVAVP